jgi:hypothetical protein
MLSDVLIYVLNNPNERSKSFLQFLNSCVIDMSTYDRLFLCMYVNESIYY